MAVNVSTNPNKTQIIGIDLGTTLSVVAVYNDGKVVIINNDKGHATTPSYVSFTENGRIIGRDAKNQLAMNSKNTFYDVKRLIGRRFNDAEVQEDIAKLPFKVRADASGGIQICADYMGKERAFFPEEISAMVLTKLKESAEAYLGAKVTEAVITVPSKFSDAQRQATIDAGRIAGLTVLRIINEPTAAALAYGLDHVLSGEKKINVLVFDLGGGTFDVSVLALHNGMFKVSSTIGNSHIGGVDFDNNLVEHCCDQFEMSHHGNGDIRGDTRAMCRLRAACEKAKEELSSCLLSTICLDALFDGVDFTTDISRTLFEDLNEELFLKLLKPVKMALRDAHLLKKEVDEVVIVGGSTRIPKVQQQLQDFFDGKQLCKSVNADEAIAHGAAIQAHLISGNPEKRMESVLLVDVVPLSLGIKTQYKDMTFFIDRNTSIPDTRSQIMTTMKDNQSVVSIEVYEGERAIVDQNTLIGTFRLTGIPPAPRGVPQIEVTFDVDANGMLSVSATDLATRITNKINISYANGRHSKEEVDGMVANAEEYLRNDAIDRERIRARVEFENYCYNTKRTLDLLSVTRKSAMEKRKSALERCKEDIRWIKSNPFASLRWLQAKRVELDAICSPILRDGADAQSDDGNNDAESGDGSSKDGGSDDRRNDALIIDEEADTDDNLSGEPTEKKMKM